MMLGKPSDGRDPRYRYRLAYVIELGCRNFDQTSWLWPIKKWSLLIALGSLVLKNRWLVTEALRNHTADDQMLMKKIGGG